MRHSCAGSFFAFASLTIPWEGRAALCALTIAAALLTGCSAPKAIHTYEYLTQYDRMTDLFEPLASLLYVSPEVDLGSYQALAIGEMDVGKQWVREPEAAKAYARLFRTLFANRLREKHAFGAVLLDPGPGFAPYEPGRALRMEGKVTVFSLGSGWKRYLSYWYPFFQGGATDFQIEARFSDAASGQVVMELADRRRHLGNTLWGPNLKTFSAEFVMKHTVKLTARCLADLIAQRPSCNPPAVRLPPGRAEEPKQGAEAIARRASAAE